MSTTITATVLDPSGQPLVGAVVVAILSGVEISGGVVAPMVVEAETGAAGTCTLSLWPNTTTTYTVRLQHPMLRPSLEWTGITVPNVEALTLVELLGGTAPTVGTWNDVVIWADAAVWSE